MSDTHITVTCTNCSFETTFSRLSAARVALADHERATGHTANWTIDSLSPGIERAGEEAGVCGIPGSSAADSPLVRSESRDASDVRSTDTE
jgi:hypothetical protein